MIRHIIISLKLCWCQQAQSLMGSCSLILDQPPVHDLLHLGCTHGAIIVVQTFPLQRPYESLYERLVLWPVRSCPVLRYASPCKPGLGLVLVLAAVVIHHRDIPAETGDHLPVGFPCRLGRTAPRDMDNRTPCVLVYAAHGIELAPRHVYMLHVELDHLAGSVRPHVVRQPDPLLPLLPLPLDVVPVL